MYAYIKGIITRINAISIELECQNIGYVIKMPNPYVFEVGNEEKVFLFQKVSDDSIDLYGFKYIEEKELFLKLISVNGIGPKSALSILATGDVSGIVSAIESGNAPYLTKFPGIGQKASQQIVLDLKGKINFEVKEQTNFGELKEALISLGYKGKEVDKVTSKLDGNLPVDELIRQALRLLTRM